MVKPLTFKGDKKVKKRKRRDHETPEEAHHRKAILLAGDETVADDDTWVSAESLGDVSGPVLLVLPGIEGSSSSKPTALACDATGKVFALPIENMVDDHPATAEPHDVRQVWVASRVAGTENVLFKGHHGRYLGCDKYGLLSASSIAVSPLESFVLEVNAAVDPEIFQLKTLRGTYLAVGAPAKKTESDLGVPEVRGDASEPGTATGIRIRMQARFKPRIKASKEERAREKVSRRELEEAVGRRLEDDEVKTLKRARREGDYHERLLDIKVKGKSDTYA
ncbi:hypothetical protein SEPCBS119000_005927 [Sporothrix epigloea]|uniref:Uncharacterized protein n=1 Tax=Sporothrix epigloea TaxID=1892477 RepID=A0ABP0E0H1_9PEZI